MKTPGVYVEEINAFPNAIMGVETALPVFIGYTERAEYEGKLLRMQPVKISSLADYEAFFGGAYSYLVQLAPVAPAPDAIPIGNTNYRLTLPQRRDLQLGLRLFYANGGRNCYAVSAGSHGDALSAGALADGLAAVRDLAGPTMLVIPEAVLLDDAGYRALVIAMLAQCREKHDRVAILDVPMPSTTRPDPIAFFHDAASAIPPDARRFGAAYYPFVQTSLVDPGSIGYANIHPATLPALQASLLDTAEPDDTAARDLIARITQVKPGDPAYATVNAALVARFPAVAALHRIIAGTIGTLPPAAAMAGVYTFSDATRGVWQAPANIAPTSVVAAAVKITTTDQQGLNVPLDGLAVNALRDFAGRGTLVWGARTLDGNSNDWRYIHVSRTVTFIEQSIQPALNAFAFEPNVAQTWAGVRSAISEFLTQLWTQGALAGASAADAFAVGCGLGSTMTGQDILDGWMIVSVEIAVVHPAEFVALTFRQTMQGGG